MKYKQLNGNVLACLDVMCNYNTDGVFVVYKVQHPVGCVGVGLR